jgi:hypothetical protein
MSITGLPGVEARFLDDVIPVKFLAGADPDRDDRVMTPVSEALRAHSMKSSVGRNFNTRGTINVISYRLLMDWDGYENFPVTEKDYIWHSEGSEYLADGSPDYTTSFEVQSIVPNKKKRYAVIEISRER